MAFQSRASDPQRLLPETLEDRILGVVSQGAGGLLCLCAVAGWLSLLSWSLDDPSLTHATSGATRNLLGAPGAVLSDLLLQTLGFAAVFVLLPPVIWGLELALARHVPDFRSKIALFPLAIVLLAGACSALPVPARWPLHHGMGGILGDVLFNLLNNVFASINPGRSGLATGLVYASTGIGALIQNLGLSGRDLAYLMQPYPSDRHRGERTSWRTWLAGLGAKASRYSRHAPAVATSGQEQHYVASPQFHVAPAGPREQQAFTGYRMAPSVEDYRPGSLFDQPPPAPLDQRRAAISRGPAFDSHTDAESREIAERFAPRGHEHDGGSGARASGLLGGFWSRRQGPAYKRPSLNLLKRPTHARPTQDFTSTVLRGTARLLEDVLADFGIKGEVKDVKPGPVVTLFEVEPARGIKASRVIALADDIARSMSATAVRVAVVPGRNVIGIELPNVRRETVLLREILEADVYKAGEATLPLALGRTISGEPVVTDLARMPHLLVAGTTGSGKSVGVNAMILSLIYKLAPEDCRFLMIDPKMLELSVYNGIPHLLTPVITDAGKAVQALNWAVSEMEERYKRMSQLGVRNIDVFNNRVRNAAKQGEKLARTVQTGIDSRTGQPIYQQDVLELEPMPYIVVVVDEFADLMISAGKEIEVAVQRLAQMARAAGIHLIMATQRPSVDIITGTIKANFPTRLSFKVASRIDSRTILNEQGAEQLLGQGDMLLSTGAGQLTRIHGPFVSDEEVEGIVAALRADGEPRYVDGITDGPGEAVPAQHAAMSRTSAEDDLYEKAVAIVLRDRKASTSYIQRRLSIGYNRAADL
ncbi:MAG: DNA translocase FtsK 4TM domain-containing protein, partial [Hyphomicrobiaceae bacterium]